MSEALHTCAQAADYFKGDPANPDGINTEALKILLKENENASVSWHNIPFVVTSSVPRAQIDHLSRQTQRAQFNSA